MRWETVAASFLHFGRQLFVLKLCCREMHSLDLQCHALTHSDTCLAALAKWQKQTTSRSVYDLFRAQTRGRLRAVCIMIFWKKSSSEHHMCRSASRPLPRSNCSAFMTGLLWGVGSRRDPLPLSPDQVSGDPEFKRGLFCITINVTLPNANEWKPITVLRMDSLRWCFSI